MSKLFQEKAYSDKILLFSCFVSIVYPIFNGVIYNVLNIINIDSALFRNLLLILEVFIMFLGIIVCLCRKWKDIIVITFVCLTILVFNYVYFEANRSLLIGLSKDLLFCYLSFLLFFCIKESGFNLVFKKSVYATSILCTLYGITSIGSMQLNMQWFSYQLLLPICGLMVFPFKNIIYSCLLLIPLFIFSVLSGSRFPLGIEIILMLFIIGRKYYRLYKNVEEVRKRKFRMRFYFFSSIFSFLLLCVKPIATQLDIITRRNGNVVRIFRLIATGDIFGFGGRFANYYIPLGSSILENPLLGTGIASDRNIVYESLIEKGIKVNQNVSSYYSHNIILEILTSFGMLIGTFLIYLFIKASISKYKLSKNKNMLIFLYFIGIVPLLLSGSYLIYNWFWILLAYICKDIKFTSIIQRISKNENYSL